MTKPVEKCFTTRTHKQALMWLKILDKLDKRVSVCNIQEYAIDKLTVSDIKAARSLSLSTAVGHLVGLSSFPVCLDV